MARESQPPYFHEVYLIYSSFVLAGSKPMLRLQLLPLLRVLLVAGTSEEVQFRRGGNRFPNEIRMVNYSIGLGGGGVTHYRNMYSIPHNPLLIIAQTVDMTEVLGYGETHSNWRIPQNPSGIAKGELKTFVKNYSVSLIALGRHHNHGSSRSDSGFIIPLFYLSNKTV